MRVEYEFVNAEQAAPRTPIDADVVTRLMAGIRPSTAWSPALVGVGGGTVAVYLLAPARPAGRGLGLLDSQRPPARRKIPSPRPLGDAKVMAHMLLA